MDADQKLDVIEHCACACFDIINNAVVLTSDDT